MPEYDREWRRHFSRAHFEALGGIYRGRGVLTWNPDRGFHIEAPVDRLGPRLKGRFELLKPRVVNREDLHAIRIAFGRSSYAVSPPLPPDPPLELLLSSQLSIDVSRMVFVERNQSPCDPAQWFGSATYAFADTILFPESFTRETRVVEQLISTEFGHGAFDVKDDDQRIRCWIPDKGTIKLEWAFRAGKWPFHYAWTFGLVAEVALSILAGQTVRLLERTASRRDREYREVRKRESPQTLGLLSPLGVMRRIDKGEFVTLAHFLNHRCVSADVCEAMFDQLAEASRQQTH
jgi:hypothetical protein